MRQQVLSSLKSDEAGGGSAQSLIQALSGLSSQSADDVASVISNFLEGLGSAAGISPEEAGRGHQEVPFEMGAASVFEATEPAARCNL